MFASKCFSSHLHWLLGAIVCSAPLLGGGHPVDQQSRPPNIVLIVADDLGWMDVGFQGNTFFETPSIDGLAKQGVWFEEFYSAGHQCSPSRAAILNGQWPARTWLTANFRQFHDKTPHEVLSQTASFSHFVARDRLGSDSPTIAESLRRAGYFTASVGKWHIGPEGDGPERHGFEVNIGGGTDPAPRSYFVPFGLSKLSDDSTPEYLTDRLTEEAVRLIRANRDQPFLLYLAHHAVHPVMGPPPMESSRTAKESLVQHFRNKADPALPEQNPTYAAMIRSLDDSVGSLLKVLEDESLTEQTVVIFTSDNGAAEEVAGEIVTSNYPLRGSKGSFYEGGIRVPTIIAAPGIQAAGTSTKVPAISIDLYPTILELAGVQPDPNQILDGLSLVPLLNGSPGLDRQALFFHFPHLQSRAALSGDAEQRRQSSSAVRADGFKLIHFWAADDELYDLATDVGETLDLAESMPEKTTALRDMLFTWLDQVGAQVPRKNPRYVPPGPWGWRTRARLYVDAGSLVASTTEPEQLLSPLIRSDGLHVLRFRMKSAAKPCGSLAFRWRDNRLSNGRLQVNSLSLDSTCDELWHDYQVPVPSRRGIRRFWFDLPGDTEDIRFDWIRLEPSRRDLELQFPGPEEPVTLRWEFDDDGSQVKQR
jgi:arylsulfatase A-like enzyme